MKFADLYAEAILWTCYLENYLQPERYLNIYGLKKSDRVVFDQLGKFFPFSEYFCRGLDRNMPGIVCDLNRSDKSLIVPWLYQPRGANDILNGKRLLCPSAEIFCHLDNKIEAKKIFKKLGIPIPQWSFTSNGGEMLEKPVKDSAGGLGIRLTANDPGENCFLEEYIEGHKSIGLQFFIYDEVEFICADEMLFDSNGSSSFTFWAQRNVQPNELPSKLIDDCLKLGEYLFFLGYNGLLGIDALVRDSEYYLLEINPRGIAFLPAYFAASACGWTDFVTYMNKETLRQEEMILLDFGKTKKVVRKL
jgi:hypothetical protein